MKILLYGILTFICPKSRTIPFFEQIAFDYFQKVIVPNENLNEKFFMSDSLVNYGGPFDWPYCLKTYSTSDSINYLKGVNVSGKREITIAQNSNFKVTNARHKINCWVNESIDMSNGNHVVNVVFRRKYSGVVYHIELDDHGSVLTWCKGGWIE